MPLGRFLYPGIWEELEFSGNSGHLVGSLRRPASVRDMISAIKQSGTISAVLGVEAAFHWFGIDLGQCLDYRLPSGLKISIDPTRQTMIWPAKPCALRSSPVADGYLGDWLASYTPGNRVFSLRYSSAYRAGLVDLAEINGTNEVAAHIRAALNQFGIKR